MTRITIVEADSLKPGDVVADIYGRERVVAISRPCDLNGSGGWEIVYEPIPCRDDERCDGHQWVSPDHRSAVRREGYRRPADLVRRRTAR